MKYQTIIKILTDAESEQEATDIAGEFLRGNIETGVKMKCYTRPVKSRQSLQNQIQRSPAKREK